MDAQANESAGARNETKTVWSDRELIVTRVFNGPARIVFDAWTKPELMMRWWVPKSFGITFLSCELDVRPGGTYKFMFGHPQSEQPMAFVGRYLEVVPHSKLVWTNEESDNGAVTTLTLEERDGKTYLKLQDLFPSKEALDEAVASGSINGYPEQFDSLEELLKSQQ